MAKRKFTTLCVTTDFYNNNFQREKLKLEQAHGVKYTNTNFTDFLNKYGLFKLPQRALRPVSPFKKKGLRCSI